MRCWYVCCKMNVQDSSRNVICYIYDKIKKNSKVFHIHSSGLVTPYLFSQQTLSHGHPNSVKPHECSQKTPPTMSLANLKSNTTDPIQTVTHYKHILKIPPPFCIHY